MAAKIGIQTINFAEKSFLGKRNRLQSGDSLSDGELDIYVNFEPARRI
jgi:hypothetical protein